MTHKIMELVGKQSMKENPPEFEIGDTVDVHCLILEGEKKRTQVFTCLLYTSPSPRD